VLTMNIHQII